MKKNWTALLATAAGGCLVIATALNVWSQTAPYLTVAPTGTNQLLITITNAGSGSYELWTTPVLGNTAAYPWTTAAVGTNGQNSFVVPTGPYPAGFFQALLDTNPIYTVFGFRVTDRDSSSQVVTFAFICNGIFSFQLPCFSDRL